MSTHLSLRLTERVFRIWLTLDFDHSTPTVRSPGDVGVKAKLALSPLTLHCVNCLLQGRSSCFRPWGHGVLPWRHMTCFMTKQAN